MDAQNRSGFLLGMVLGLALGGVSGCVVGAYAGAASSTDEASSTAADPPSAPAVPAPKKVVRKEKKDRTIIVEGRMAVREKLRDPSSAKFDREFVSRSSGLPVACGEVNAKNGLGGYTGSEKYVARGDVAFLESEVKPADWPTLYAELCGAAP